MAIGVAVVVLAVLAGLDVQQDGRAALEYFAEDQVVVARSLAVQLETRLIEARNDAWRFAESATSEAKDSASPTDFLAARWRRADEQPLDVDVDPELVAVRISVTTPDGHVVDLVAPLSELTERLAAFERPASTRLLLSVPGETGFRAMDGRRLAAGPIISGIARGATSVHLSDEEAAAIGLPARMAFAGLASVDVEGLGRWDVAYVASANRVRDREGRARVRLVLSALTAAGLVMGFGALALRRQRLGLELTHELAVAGVEREHERRLETANRAATLGTLAMGIAHEIATPASVIQGRAEQLLRRAGTDERQTSSLQAILEQASGITAVVRGFLDLARGDAPPSGVVVVEALIDGALGLVEHRFMKARVALSAVVADGLPDVIGDARLLEHALVNLLLNACDACSRGGTVTVHARVAGEQIELSVVDDGTGISPDDISHVTRPFFTTKEIGKGTGLGLAISNEIVRAHRGTLRLAPREPRGTSASILLPVLSREPP
ncbi:MAG: ATP-binding protein [Deltaproteobacteria bacterium]|nr:ATP-binding protein [Deltaproteobacteria bacterium]